MNVRHAITSIAFMALCATLTDARAQDLSKYPNWKGQWSRIINATLNDGLNPGFDEIHAFGRGQNAPLTPEYEKVFEESLADQAKGGQGNYYTVFCRARGMPNMMTFGNHEYIITSETTYILLGGEDRYRRIFTDGRDWPKALEPTYQGYSLGRWVDEDGDGTFDTLLVETRGPFKGPRSFDASGLPLHFDNDSIFRERLYIDKANILHDEITTIDRALTRPWTVDKRYRRNPNPLAVFPEQYCLDENNQIRIAKENYFLDHEGVLMPAKKDQAPPDLKYFKKK